jgi:hypothetical protein
MTPEDYLRMLGEGHMPPRSLKDRLDPRPTPNQMLAIRNAEWAIESTRPAATG